jgi:hypothetical protein
LTTNTPYNKPKVSLKLHELEYKLDVEKKVLDGIKTMADALDKQSGQADRKQRDEIKNQMHESIEKLALLNRALRKYKGLYIGEAEDEDEDYGMYRLPISTRFNHQSSSSLLYRTRNAALSTPSARFSTPCHWQTALGNPRGPRIGSCSDKNDPIP